MPYYRILALDGGGIRGVLTISLLQRMEEVSPGFLKSIDLFAGTSTGGILALALAAEKTPAEALELYEQKGEEVFRDSVLDNIKDAGTLLGAQYSNTGLIQALTEQFGEMTLGDLKHRVLVSSFDLDNTPANPDVLRTWKAKFFHNYPCPGTDAAQKVVDVAIRTAAAPTFFPVYQGFIDGGVVANNPSMCALAQAVDKGTGGQRLTGIALLSVGTGGYPRYLEVENADWGLTQWGKSLIDIMLEGSVDLADYQCGRILGKRYMRIKPRLSRPISLGDIREIHELKNVAMQYDLTEANKWVKRYFSSS